MKEIYIMEQGSKTKDFYDALLSFEEVIKNNDAR